MPVTEDQLVPALIGAVVGLILGYFFGRRGAPGSEENRELQRELSKARDDQARFEQRVNAHFADTAGKLNTLTENYREVYQQIATGAADLCSSKKGPRFEALAAPAAAGSTEAAKDDDSIDADSIPVEPPRDYATETASDDDSDTLEEKFDKDDEESTAEESKERS